MSANRDHLKSIDDIEEFARFIEEIECLHNIDNLEDKFHLLYQKDKYGLSPLHIAIQLQRPKIVISILELLKKNNALELIDQATNDGCTPLHFAALVSNFEIVQMLISALGDQAQIACRKLTKTGKLPIDLAKIGNGPYTNKIADHLLNLMVATEPTKSLSSPISLAEVLEENKDRITNNSKLKDHLIYGVLAANI